jgi:hypothetical protein
MCHFLRRNLKENLFLHFVSSGIGKAIEVTTLTHSCSYRNSCKSWLGLCAGLRMCWDCWEYGTYFLLTSEWRATLENYILICFSKINTFKNGLFTKLTKYFISSRAPMLLFCFFNSWKNKRLAMYLYSLMCC